MALYKWLDNDGHPCNGGNGHWNLPKKGKPGAWMPRIDDLQPCLRGYHLCREDDLLYWIGPALFLADCRGEAVESDDKVVCAQARLFERIDTWSDRSARLFAADCARDCLHLYESVMPNDSRPRDAIQAARNYANGSITAAARDAAGAAAGDAAWAAAWAAARPAARAAAWAAAWAAARAAAGDAARGRQLIMLAQYIPGLLGEFYNGPEREDAE